MRPQLERQQAAVKERTLELGPALAEELGATLLSSRGGWQGNWHQMGVSTCAYDSGTTMRMPATATKP